MFCFSVFESTINYKLNTGPVVATYEFSAVATEMMKRFYWADVLDGNTTQKTFEKIRKKWQEGDGQLLFLQVKAGSHGLDFCNTLPGRWCILRPYGAVMPGYS